MKKFFFLFFFIVSFFINNAQATHYAAVDVYYDYVAPLTYKVHLISYRDCSPGNAFFGTQDVMCVSSTSCGQNINFNVDTAGANDPLNGTLVDHLCPSIQNRCENSSSLFVGFEYWHYVQTVTLPAACNDWKFIWSTCCRNTTSNLAGQPGISAIAELNNLARPVNSSSRLTALVKSYACNQQANIMIHAPMDPDNDSIHVTSISPQQNASCATGTSSNCTYSGLLGPNDPIGCSGSGCILDPITGNFTFTPNNIGNYVLTFKVDEYDKITKVKMGSIMRDLQISVINCNAPFPTASSNLSTQTINTCPGVPVTFTASGTSQSGSNKLFIYGNQNAIGLSGTPVLNVASPNGAANNSATFSWTPSASDFGPHVVIITMADSTCSTSQPVVLHNYVTLVINVLQGISASDVNLDYCLFGEPIQLNATGATTYFWQELPGSANSANLSNPNIANPLASPNGQVSIEVTGFPAVGQCANKDTVTINVHSPITLSAGADKYICANDTLNIVTLTNQPGGTSDWLPKQYIVGNTTSLNMTTVPLEPIGYQIRYQAPSKCFVKDSVYIYPIGIRPIINAYAAKDPVCIGDSLQLFANAATQHCGKAVASCLGNSNDIIVGKGNISTTAFSPFYRDFNSNYRTQYLFLATELKDMGFGPGFIKGFSFDLAQNILDPNINITKNLSVKMGCTSISSMSAANGFVNGLTEVFTAPSHLPTYPTTTFNFSPSNQFYWDGMSNMIIEFCYALPPFVGATTTPVFSTPTMFNSVIADQVSQGNLCSNNASAINSLIGSLRPNFTFNFCKASPFSYIWSPASNFIDNTVENPIIKSNIISGASTSYTLITNSDTAICSATKTITVLTDQTGSISATADKIHICNPSVVTLIADPLSTQAPTYQCGEENVTRIDTTISNTIAKDTFKSNSSPFSYYPNSKYQYLLTKVQLNAYGIVGPNYIDSLALNVLVKNSTTPFNDLILNLSCTSANSLPEDFSNIGFGKIVYASSAFSTNVGWNTFQFQSPFLWNGNDNILVQLCYSSLGSSIFVDDEVQVSTTAATVNFQQVHNAAVGNSGCSLPNGVGFVPVTRMGQEFPNTKLFTTKAAPKPFQYAWEPSTNMWDSTTQNATVYVDKSTIYTVSLFNKSGCKIKDTVLVELVNHGLDIQPSDTSFCASNGFQIVPKNNDLNFPLQYRWFTTDYSYLDSNKIINGTIGISDYILITLDQFGCSDTAYAKYQVSQSPKVEIFGPDTIYTIKNKMYKIDAVGSEFNNWQPSIGITSPNQPNTYIQSNGPGWYYLVGKHSLNNCVGKDSIYIAMIQNDPLAIPNVFSPNNDQHNPIFKILNLYHEQVISFKVYDRWGQVIFSTQDNNGWDGTKNGKDVPQDTYYYQIQLGSINGEKRNLSGEVLLVR